jgi:hypothetical protein
MAKNGHVMVTFSAHDVPRGRCKFETFGVTNE